MKKPKVLTVDSEVSVRINDAQEDAVRALGSSPSARTATQENLDRLAAMIKERIRDQVADGLWPGVVAGGMNGLVVYCRLGNRLLGESPIQIEYDFSRTVKPALIVDPTARGRG